MKPGKRFSVCLLILFSWFLNSPLLFATDLSVTAGNVVASAAAKKVTGIAGETITAGQTIYRKIADNRLYKADANATANGEYKVRGIALNGASAGQGLTVCTYDPSFTPGATVTAGAVVIASANAGGLAPAADAATGWYVTVLGIGIGSNKMKLDFIASGVAK